MSRKRFEPEHGGNLVDASAHYGIPREQWLDLSTGMNPVHYPVSHLPTTAFTELPYHSSAFEHAVGHYYGSDQWLAVAGSQVAIENLPNVLADIPVLMPEVGYQEHAKAWQKRQVVTRYPSCNPHQQIAFIDQALTHNTAQHLVVINPNNPSGVMMPVVQLNQWASRLTDGGCVIVDEAFIDLTPEQSMLGSVLADNVIVLRSFGKFFGLAGVRLGFVFASSKILADLKQYISLWQLNGPAQALAIQAFNDKLWQDRAREEIGHLNQQMQLSLSELKDQYRPDILVEQGLFISWRLAYSEAYELVEGFAVLGVLLRLIKVSDSQAIVRFGLLNAPHLTEFRRRINVVV